MSHQQRFPINIWARILSDCMLGTYVLPNRLIGRRYRRFLHNKLPPLLENTPLAVRQEIKTYFMYDGASAHFSRIDLAHLNGHYPEHWVGTGGPTAWPSCSLDLNSLVFLCGAFNVFGVVNCCRGWRNTSCTNCEGLSKNTCNPRHFWACSYLNAMTSRSLHYGRGWTFGTILVKYWTWCNIGATNVLIKLLSCLSQ